MIILFTLFVDPDVEIVWDWEFLFCVVERSEEADNLDRLLQRKPHRRVAQYNYLNGVLVNDNVMLAQKWSFL